MICHQMDYRTAMKIQWKTDIMEVIKYDFQSTYRVTGAATEGGPYEHNNAASGNEWLNLGGLRRD